MTLKLTVPDYTFPMLEWEQALRLVRDLGVDGVDISLFAGRSHLRPESVFLHPAKEAAEILTSVHSHGLDIADIFAQPGSVFEEEAVNHTEPGEHKKAADFFWRFLELDARSNTKNMTLLPGMRFEQESFDNSLNRSAEELT